MNDLTRGTDGLLDGAREAGRIEHAHFRLSVGNIDAEGIDVHTFESSGHAVSGDYRFRIRIRPYSQFDPDALLGSPGRLTIERGDDPSVVHGIVVGVETDGARFGADSRLIELASPLALPAIHRHHRVFRRRTATAIAEECLRAVLGDVARVSVEADEEPAELPMVVQDNETDLDFVRRVLARDGLFLGIRQLDDEAEVVIHDDLQAVIDRTVTLRYAPQTGQVRGSRETAHSVRAWAGLEPGRVTLRDFDPAHPDRNGPGERGASDDADTAGTLRLFGQRGGGQEALDALAGVHMQALDARRQGLEIETECRRLSPGVTVEITDHPDDDLNGTYVVTEARHRGDQRLIVRESEQRATYLCTASLLPVAVPYRELPEAPRSTTGGLLVGEVEGPDDDRAHLDDYGRYRVRYALDQGDAGEANASPPVPASQPYGGRDYGLHFPFMPRTRVAMAPLNGDTERPVILGALSGAVQPSPVNTSNAYQHLLRTPAGHALCLSDRPGAQRVTLASAKAGGGAGVSGEGEPRGAAWLDMRAGDQDEHRIDLVTEEGEMRLQAGADMQVNVGGNRTVTVEGSQETAVTGDVSVRSEEGNLAYSAGEALEMTTDSGDLLLETTGGHVTIDAAESAHLSSGDSLTFRSEEGSMSLAAQGGLLHLHGETGITMVSGAGEDILIGNGHGLVIRDDGTVVLEGTTIEIVASEIIQSADTVSGN